VSEEDKDKKKEEKGEKENKRKERRMGIVEQTKTNLDTKT
jgi:hypothetical protein